VRAVAAASDEDAERGALRVLVQAGSSADAVIAGFLEAAAQRASVLFAPVQILTAGPGIGTRAFDGRSRQPGLGTRRPRGFVSGAPVPLAARVAVPASLAVLSLLHAHDARLALDKLTAPASARALAAGASRRSAVLARYGSIGPTVLAEARVARPLLSLGGPPEGGLLTQRDLTEVRPMSEPPREADLGAGYAALSVPWAPGPRAHRRAEIIAAVDARGVLTVLAYHPDDDGVPVPDLELTLPRDADIVQRGIPRTRPGEPLECPAPIALVSAAGKPFLAFGVSATRKLRINGLTGVVGEAGLGAAAWLASAMQAIRGSAAFGVLSPLEGGEPARVVLKETG
jgi:gamma-glutamyltranspeptidase/glutathione hydrolase